MHSLDLSPLPPPAAVLCSQRLNQPPLPIPHLGKVTQYLSICAWLLPVKTTYSSATSLAGSRLSAEHRHEVVTFVTFGETYYDLGEYVQAGQVQERWSGRGSFLSRRHLEEDGCILWRTGAHLGDAWLVWRKEGLDSIPSPT